MLPRLSRTFSSSYMDDGGGEEGGPDRGDWGPLLIVTGPAHCGIDAYLEKMLTPKKVEQPVVHQKKTIMSLNDVSMEQMMSGGYGIHSSSSGKPLFSGGSVVSSPSSITVDQHSNMIDAKTIGHSPTSVTIKEHDEEKEDALAAADEDDAVVTEAGFDSVLSSRAAAKYFEFADQAHCCGIYQRVALDVAAASWSNTAPQPLVAELKRTQVQQQSLWYRLKSQRCKEQMLLVLYFKSLQQREAEFLLAEKAIRELSSRFQQQQQMKQLIERELPKQQEAEQQLKERMKRAINDPILFTAFWQAFSNINRRNGIAVLQQDAVAATDSTAALNKTRLKNSSGGGESFISNNSNNNSFSGINNHFRSHSDSMSNNNSFSNSKSRSHSRSHSHSMSNSSNNNINMNISSNNIAMNNNSNSNSFYDVPIPVSDKELFSARSAQDILNITSRVASRHHSDIRSSYINKFGTISTDKVATAATVVAIAAATEEEEKDDENSSSNSPRVPLKLQVDGIELFIPEAVSKTKKDFIQKSLKKSIKYQKLPVVFFDSGLSEMTMLLSVQSAQSLRSMHSPAAAAAHSLRSVQSVQSLQRPPVGRQQQQQQEQQQRGQGCYYSEALLLACKYGRKVQFIRWGQELPAAGLSELCERNILSLLLTGRYTEISRLSRMQQLAESLRFDATGAPSSHQELAHRAGFIIDEKGLVAPISPTKLLRGGPYRKSFSFRDRDMRDIQQSSARLVTAAATTATTATTADSTDTTDKDAATVQANTNDSNAAVKSSNSGSSLGKVGRFPTASKSSTTASQQLKEPVPKHGFWSRLFGRKGGNNSSNNLQPQQQNSDGVDGEYLILGRAHVDLSLLAGNSILKSSGASNYDITCVAGGNSSPQQQQEQQRQQQQQQQQQQEQQDQEQLLSPRSIHSSPSKRVSFSTEANTEKLIKLPSAESVTSCDAGSSSTSTSTSTAAAVPAVSLLTADGAVDVAKLDQQLTATATKEKKRFLFGLFSRNIRKRNASAEMRSSSSVARAEQTNKSSMLGTDTTTSSTGSGSNSSSSSAIKQQKRTAATTATTTSVEAEEDRTFDADVSGLLVTSFGSKLNSRNIKTQLASLKIATQQQQQEVSVPTNSPTKVVTEDSSTVTTTIGTAVATAVISEVDDAVSSPSRPSLHRSTSAQRAASMHFKPAANSLVMMSHTRRANSISGNYDDATSTNANNTALNSAEDGVQTQLLLHSQHQQLMGDELRIEDDVSIDSDNNSNNNSDTFDMNTSAISRALSRSMSDASLKYEAAYCTEDTYSEQMAEFTDHHQQLLQSLSFNAKAAKGLVKRKVSSSIMDRISDLRSNNNSHNNNSINNSSNNQRNNHRNNTNKSYNSSNNNNNYNNSRADNDDHHKPNASIANRLRSFERSVFTDSFIRQSTISDTIVTAIEPRTELYDSGSIKVNEESASQISSLNGGDTEGSPVVADANVAAVDADTTSDAAVATDATSDAAATPVETFSGLISVVRSTATDDSMKNVDSEMQQSSPQSQKERPPTTDVATVATVANDITSAVVAKVVEKENGAKVDDKITTIAATAEAESKAAEVSHTEVPAVTLQETSAEATSRDAVARTAGADDEDAQRAAEAIVEIPTKSAVAIGKFEGEVAETIKSVVVGEADEPAEAAIVIKTETEVPAEIGAEEVAVPAEPVVQIRKAEAVKAIESAEAPVV